MGRMIFTTSLLIFSVQFLFGQSITKEEYSVYDFILNKIYNEQVKYQPKLNIVILTETLSASKPKPNSKPKTEPQGNETTTAEDDEYIKKISEKYKDFNKSLEESKTSNDFSVKFKISQNIQPKLFVEFSYILVKKNEVDALIKSGKNDFEKAKRKGEKFSWGEEVLFGNIFIRNTRILMDIINFQELDSAQTDNLPKSL